MAPTTYQIHAIPTANSQTVDDFDVLTMITCLGNVSHFFLWHVQQINAVGVPISTDQDKIQVSDEESSTAVPADLTQVQAVQKIVDVLRKYPQGVKLEMKHSPHDRWFRLRFCTTEEPRDLYHHALVLEPLTSQLQREIDGKEEGSASQKNGETIFEIDGLMASYNPSEDEVMGSLQTRSTF